MFKKEDLKFGDIITLRNRVKFIYLGNGIARSCDDEYINLKYHWKENFRHEDNFSLDIIKIKRYMEDEFYFD